MVLSLEESVNYDLSSSRLDESIQSLISSFWKNNSISDSDKKSMKKLDSNLKKVVKINDKNLNNLFKDIAKNGKDGKLKKGNFRGVIPRYYYRYIDVSKLQRKIDKTNDISDLMNLNIGDYLVNSDGETRKMLDDLGVNEVWKKSIKKYNSIGKNINVMKKFLSDVMNFIYSDLLHQLLSLSIKGVLGVVFTNYFMGIVSSVLIMSFIFFSSSIIERKLKDGERG